MVEEGESVLLHLQCEKEHKGTLFLQNEKDDEIQTLRNLQNIITKLPYRW